jgi:hypothetical protein
MVAAEKRAKRSHLSWKERRGRGVGGRGSGSNKLHTAEGFLRWDEKAVKKFYAFSQTLFAFSCAEETQLWLHVIYHLEINPSWAAMQCIAHARKQAQKRMKYSSSPLSISSVITLCHPSI